MLKNIVSHVAAIAVAILGVTAFAQAESPKQIDVPAGDLVAALESISKQSNIELVFQPEQLKGLRTNGVSGQLSVQDAVRKLLEGTQLRLSTDENTGAMMIGAAGSAVKTSGNSNTGDISRTFRLADSSENSENKSSAQKSDAPPAEAASGKLEEVVVTAQRREQRLQDVPISVTVLGGEALERKGETSLFSALNRTPGVVALSNNTGVARLGNNPPIVIRGVSPATGAGTTGYYLDTVPFGLIAGSFAPDLNVFDLDRVEVVRGPQGTLYGVSSLNGVVRVLTHDAELDRFDAKARTGIASTKDGDPSYRGDLALNIPIVNGKLATRVIAGYQKAGGWIDKSFKADANDTVTKNFRLKVNAVPNENLSIGLGAWFSRLHSGAPAISPDNRQSPSLLDEPSDTDFDQFSANLAYDFGPVRLTSTTGYLDYFLGSLFDYTPFRPAFPTQRLQNKLSSNILSEEVVLNSDLEGPWRWTLGGIYRKADEHSLTFRQEYGEPAEATAESESAAVFGEVTRAFADGRWELTGGLRYFEDDVSNVEISAPFSAGGIPAGGLRSAHGEYHKLTPRAVVTWHPAQKSTLYASYAQGFRSGLNQDFTVAATGFGNPGPDTLTNYEVGYKGSLLDNRLTVEAAAFYIRWDNVQQSLSVQVSPGNFTGAFVNGESASGPGAELAVSVEPIDRLHLSVSYSWNDLTLDAPLITRPSATTQIQLLPKGSRLLGSAETTFAVSSEYSFPIGATGYTGRLNLTGNYVPRILSLLDAFQPGVLPSYYIESMTVVRASAAVEARRNWTVMAYVDNALDQDAVAFDNLSTRWNAHQRPLTLGLQLDYRY